MKRCPECLFIYPDADSRCDFDNTPLVAVDDSEIEAVTDQKSKTPKSKHTTTKPPRKTNERPRTTTTQPRTTKEPPRTPTKHARTTTKRARKTTTLAAVVGLLLGLSAFIIYYRATHHHTSTPLTQNTAQLQATPKTR